VDGTPGQALAMFMDGPTVEVAGNAQDGVGNTMNSGQVMVHGSVGDVLGYGMRRGQIFVKGDAGYRAGIHMKADEGPAPLIVCGGKARDFFGEYMAGGLLVLLGMHSAADGPIVGGHVGAGMHGGEIFIRGSVEDWACGTEVSVSPATDAEKAGLRPVLADYCRTFGMSLDEVLSAAFTRIAPTGSRPYARLYTYL
jgi:glutamate synthase domain-containing protein 3